MSGYLGEYKVVFNQLHPTKNPVGLDYAKITAGSHRKLWWLCDKSTCEHPHEWEAHIDRRTRSGTGCPFCSKLKFCQCKSLTGKNPKLVAEWHPSKNGELTTDDVTTNSQKKVWWLCDKSNCEHPHEWQSTVANRTKGNGCPHCNHKLICECQSVSKLFPELMLEWDEENDKDPKATAPGSDYKAKWNCSQCGRIWESQVKSRTSKLKPGCFYCGFSVLTGQVKACRDKKYIDDPSKIKEDNKKDKCIYIFKKGKNKDQPCGKDVFKKTKYCRFHKTENDEKKDEERKKEENKPEKILTIKKDGSLRINNVDIICRSTDGKVNITQLFKASGKKLNSWFKSQKTQAFLKVLSSVIPNGADGNPALCRGTDLSTPNGVDCFLITYEDHGPKERSTWAHPQVVINAAQWISPEFDVQVSKWIYELALTGQVILGQEKSQEDLDSKWKEKCEEWEEKCHQLEEDKKILIKKNSKLTSNLNKIRKWHHYVKFDLEGPCYYVYTVTDLATGKHAKLRAGKAGTGGISQLDDRLKTHRGDDVNMQVRMVITSSAANIKHLEDTIKFVYSKYRTAPNHEVFSPELDIGDFLDTVKKTIELICITEPNGYNYIPEDKLRTYNEDVQTTLIKPYAMIEEKEEF